MKKATRRLLGAIFALVVAVAVSIGATFAWFTTNDTATISGITGQVTSGDSSLQIKLVKKDGSEVGGSDWAYNLDLTELGKDIMNNDTAEKTLKFEALTWTGESVNALTERDGETKGKPATIGESTDGTGANYLDFVIAVRSQKQLQIYLGDESKVEKGDVVNDSEGLVNAWKDITTEDYGIAKAVSTGDVIKAEAQNAVRVGFAMFNSKPTDVHSDKANSTALWAPNEAELTGKVATTNTSGHGAGYWKGQLSKDYENQLPGEHTDIETAYSTTKYDTANGIDNKGKSDENSLIYDMESATLGGEYYVGYIHVAIWIEGTDGDCFNNIFNDSFKVNIVLQAKEPEAV